MRVGIPKIAAREMYNVDTVQGVLGVQKPSERDRGTARRARDVWCGTRRDTRVRRAPLSAPCVSPSGCPLPTTVREGGLTED
jgi:hypothetical protein